MVLYLFKLTENLQLVLQLLSPSLKFYHKQKPFLLITLKDKIMFNHLRTTRMHCGNVPGVSNAYNFLLMFLFFQ